MENERVFRIETERLLHTNLVVIEIRDLRVVTEHPGFSAGHGLRLLFLQQRERLCLVQQRKQSRRRDLRRGLDCFRCRRPIFHVERQYGGVALNQLEDVGALVPANVEVRGRLARERTDGQERRALRMRELKLSRCLSVGSDAYGVNRRNRGRAD